jgi:hypothetical protein
VFLTEEEATEEELFVELVRIGTEEELIRI